MSVKQHSYLFHSCNYGPLTAYIQGLPTSCSFDVSIVPIPSIVLLVALSLLAWRIHSQSLSTRRSTASSPNTPPLPNYLHYAYVALVVALLGMRILEITRLAIAQMGVGLLPFGIFANLAILGLIGIRGGNRTLVASLVSIFFFLIIAISHSHLLLISSDSYCLLGSDTCSDSPKGSSTPIDQQYASRQGNSISFF